MSTRHVAENIALLGSILGKPDGTSTLGDTDHRFASLSIAGSGIVDYFTTLQFKKAGVATIKIESDGRISGLVDPLYNQDVATKYYVDTHGGGGGGGHIIQDEGSSLTQRTKLNFVGSGVTATDDSGNDATVVTVSAGIDNLIYTITGDLVTSLSPNLVVTI